MERESRRVAVLSWSEDDGIAAVLIEELEQLGYDSFLARVDRALPRDVDVLFTYGPYGRLLGYLSQFDAIPEGARPVTVHWNTEGMPDLRIPWPLVKVASAVRSTIDRHLAAGEARFLPRSLQKLSSLLGRRWLRFRYLGDLYYARQRGWIQVIGDTSDVYACLRSEHGLPTLFAPWGATNRWFADLNLERDIDVLWMGKRGSRRRSRALDLVRDQLEKRGVRVHVADNEENPFIFGATRTRYLNRAKVTLNLTRTWYDDNFSRFALAAPNRSLFVSEPLLPHCPPVEAGVHYVAAPQEKLADVIVDYLNDETKRRQIVRNAYELVTTELTLEASIATIMEAAEATTPSSNTLHSAPTRVLD